MATMLELYEQKKNLPAIDNRILDLGKVDASKAKDLTPMSQGNDAKGNKNPDEAGIGKLETNSESSPGNRYGIAKATLGGGSEFLTNGYTDAKTYTSTNPR